MPRDIEEPLLGRQRKRLVSLRRSFEEELSYHYDDETAYEVDEVDEHNGFSLQEHFTLKSSLHKSKGFILLNEGSQQFIFEPMKRYSMYNDHENGFFALPPHTTSNNPFEESLQGREMPKSFLGSSSHNPVAISVKKAKRYGAGFLLVKLGYSYVAFVLCGYLVAIALIILLQYTLGVFLAGLASKNHVHFWAAIESLLCLPVILQSLSIILNMFFGILRDGLDDFSFLHSIKFIPKLFLEWFLTLGGFLIPLLVLMVSFLSGTPAPGQYALLSCLWFLLIFYALYGVLIVGLQISACTALIKDNREVSLFKVFWELLKMRLVVNFSWSQSYEVLHNGSDASEIIKPLPRLLDFFYYRCTERIYDFDRFGKVQPYFTEDSPFPSIMLLFCIVDKHTKGTISFSYFLSAVLCLLLVVAMIWLLFVSYLVYDAGFSVRMVITLAASTALMALSSLIWNKDTIKRVYSLATSPETRSQNLDGTIAFSSLYEKKRYRRYTVAKPKFYTALALNVVGFCLMVVMPLNSFATLGVGSYFWVYLSLSVVLGFNTIFNIRNLIEVLGPAAQQRLERIYKGSRAKHEKARSIFLLVTRLLDPTRGMFFLLVLTVAIVFSLTLAAAALNDTVFVTSGDGMSFLGTAENRSFFVPRPSVKERGFQYPACDLGFDKVDLLDFAFLSESAYLHTNITQPYLDQWFGEGKVELIARNDFPPHIPERRSKTTFKVVKIRQGFEGKDIFVITVRGTTSALDLLSDVQSWLPSITVQILRFIVPAGEIWNSLVPTLIHYMALLEQVPTEQTAYYVDVINVASGLKAAYPEAAVAVTGHSLGGGVAIIAGARLKIPAIAFSGPNSKLAHLKFSLTNEALDKFTLNIIPERDPFPRVDDPSLMAENIRCRAAPNEPSFVCHEIVRTVCEILYTCGSGLRYMNFALFSYQF